MKNVKESLNKTETWAFNDLIPWLTTTNFTPSAHGLNIENSGSITYTMQGLNSSARESQNEVFKIYLQGDTTNIPVNISDATVDSFQIVVYDSGTETDAPYVNPIITYDQTNNRTEYKFIVSANTNKPQGYQNCNWIFFYHKLNGTQSKPAISYLEDLFIEMVHEYVHWSNTQYLNIYGDVEVETRTEITTRSNLNTQIYASNKTLRSSSYKCLSSWPVSPGDKIAFRFTDTSGKTVIYYTNSSETLYTNRLVWCCANSTAVNQTVYPLGNLEDKYIEGQLYKVFTVPANMNYLVAGITYSSGTANLENSLTATVLKIETSTQKGWSKQNMYIEENNAWH